jgi:hypothetical protein
MPKQAKVFDLQIGPTTGGLGQGHEIFVGEANAAIGTAAIDPKEVGCHPQGLQRKCQKAVASRRGP